MVLGLNIEVIRISIPVIFVEVGYATCEVYSFGFDFGQDQAAVSIAQLACYMRKIPAKPIFRSLLQ